MVAAIVFVFHQIPLTDLFDRNRHEEMVDIGGLDIIVGGIALGLLAIILAGTLGLLATRRAVAPLVDALGRQRRFVADASHELRTPLAILDTRLQVLERSMPADDANRELVDELRGDSRNLINVVNDLLDSVDVTSTGVVPSRPVAPSVTDAATSMRVIAEERGIHLRVDAIPDDRRAAIPPASLHRALVALIDNAVKHSPAGGEVLVTTGTDRTTTWIAVRDHGAGIQGISPERVFDRFARSSLAVDGGGSARTGFGIGLSLVQDTVGRFGGTVEVTSTSENGTTITMTLPHGRR
ncbi:HAMP domain-containing sensor histidine kinase [Microbacterium sp. NFH-22A-Y]|uniref:Sensor-like histidine kinase SenX3 n=2 Tax=Microbacterium hominis TaxID=162426 RepID=A0A2K9DFP6_9MICO|nr:HAMP domain-containing sensor histidine kinase [Microbacterium sp. NFH-22A-Y]AUG31021.1 sensor histidine kinase [Microbacterium hominis]